MTVMIVGGPNARNDYHINETPEWFYQYRGSMLLKVVDDGEFKDLWINEREMFLLPRNSPLSPSWVVLPVLTRRGKKKANTPHNPVRFANTVGIVIEQPRPESSLDRLRWYCQGCKQIVHEAAFHCTDLGAQIKDAVIAFKEDEKVRTCKNCGEVAAAAPPAKK